MLRNLGLFGLTISLCALPACAADDGFSSAQPETSAYQLELTGNGASEGITTADWHGAMTEALSTSAPEYLQHTRDAIKALNDAVARILDPVAHAIAATARTEPIGQSVTYGPHDEAGATYKFIETRIDAKTFGWELDAKPLGAADSMYQKVMGGLFHLGDQPRRGEGIFGADLDKLAAVDATFHGNGQMLVGFAHVGGYKVLAYGLKNFSPDVTQFDPIDAVFSGWKGPLGEAHVRLGVYANLADSPTDAKELVLLHARWLPGVGGRADAVAVAGDVPAGHAWVANSCWDRDLSDVDGFFLLRDCSLDALGLPSCTVIRAVGQPSSCAPDLADEQLPSKDPMDTTQDPGAPTTAMPPASMP
jgi:hypothetical protein